MAPPNYEQLLLQLRLPGLMIDEHNVAMRWLEQKGGLYDEINFNVPLGPIPPTDVPMDDSQRKQYEFLYRTKADIVARSGTAWTIIEVKKRATKGALGQLAHYRYWFLKEHPDVQTVFVRVIAEWSDAGIAETLLAHDVDLELYGDPF